jgi:transposase
MERISMRKLKEVFRLKFEKKLSNTKIANSINISETTVERYLFRAKKANINWPLSTDTSDEKLEALLYPRKTRKREISLPDFFYIYKELKKKGVTLTGLWEEYNDIYPNGYGYSRFCALCNKWCSRSELWMPQDHKAGEASFIDYAGLTIPISDPINKSSFNAQIFVGVLGASSYTYVEATNNQELKNWISSHKRMFNFYGGVPETLVPDNLKSGVIKPDLYEPDLNPTYYEMAKYYGTTILPARVRRPKDKAKVENAVLNVERKLLAPLRHRQFFNLQELNQILWERLDNINKTPFQKIPSSSRYSLFIELEKPALKPLPATPYEFSYWKKALVNLGYHVNIEDVFYSVPHTFVKKSVEIRYNERIVEVFHKGEQIALHMRKYESGKYITNSQHQPLHHRHQAECTPENIREQACQIGENTMAWIEEVLVDSTTHINQRKKTCLGVIRLLKMYPSHRLEKACKRGLYYKNFSYKGIKGILENNFDQNSIPIDQAPSRISQEHDNIRGAKYFESEGVQNDHTSHY